VELVEQLTQPDALGRGVHHCAVLSFRIGTRHGRLSLRRPRDEGVTKEDAKARGAISCILRHQLII
jgi:hypothetical protein